MACKFILFSPTGGTQRVAEYLAHAFCTAPEVIDLCQPSTDFSAVQLTEDDLCIVAVPAFAGRVPAIAATRLQQIQGHQAKAILVAVYGNRAFEDTLVELYDILSAQDFRCVAGVGAVAEHSIMRQFGTGRPDTSDIDTLTRFSHQIADKLVQGDFSAPQLPGNRPYRAYTPSPMHPQADPVRCTRCGACAPLCPVGAIPLEHPEQTASHCISCMRCIQVCPHQARELNTDMLAMLTQRLAAACEVRKENTLYL